MTDPTSRNRLTNAPSPYLTQHADNPVNWQPWDDAALEAARDRDVPIFLSIGYAACHWCHVMEDESFQDEAIAATLNEQFVPIKVDREQRPDLDSLYQTICQLVTGGGGWPLSVWLTPAGKPFYVGTYFPPEPRGQIPAFGTLLENVAESWADPDQREQMEQRAEQWSDAIEDELSPVPDQPDHSPSDDILESAAERALSSVDEQFGGFGTGQKFPQTGRIQALIRAADTTGRDAYGVAAIDTLDAICSGGLFDHVGGGFHRYTTDREWTVPHFEKMLYDNAELTRALLAGYQYSNTERFRRAANRTIEFVDRELSHPDGGFFATLDAQSEGTEGAFYVWTPEAIHDAVDNDTAGTLFCDRYGVTEAGNFENHTTVLTIDTSIEELAKSHDLDESTVETHLRAARKALFERRSTRERPSRDEKVIAGWNGLMCRAIAEATIVSQNDSHAERAIKALTFVRDRLWRDGTLYHDSTNGTLGEPGFLSDYAFVGRGALACYEATGEVDWLALAIELAEAIEREFWDETKQTLYFTPESGEELLARPQELSDQSTPSSTGVAVELLGALDGFATHDRFAEIAAGVLETHAAAIKSDPLRRVTLALAMDEYTSGHTELTIVDRQPAQPSTELAEMYLPRRLLAPRPPELTGWLDRLGLESPPPLWANRTDKDGVPTVYCCQQFSCSPPQSSVSDAVEWFERN
ncbi:thioredoxin domain-containing protein [Halocatena halophila]|uniref:thioredoxin domain-containing protein n=1 Tax=Halocatena halophila TaxID=2814576 RepID=UPI002ED20B57